MVQKESALREAIGARKREKKAKAEAAEETEQEESKASEESAKTPVGLLAITSLLIPLVGIIAGLIFLAKDSEDDKDTGQLCLGMALFGIGLGAVIIGLGGVIIGVWGQKKTQALRQTLDDIEYEWEDY